MKDTMSQLRVARRTGTPLICIRTADPAGTIEAVKNGDFWHPSGKKGGYAALLSWDIQRGLVAIDREGDREGEAGKDKPGEKALKQCLGEADQSASTNPVEALGMLQRLPTGGICFFLNGHRFMDEIGPPQAIWNLRDTFKSNMRMLVILCPSVTLPAELQQDVLVIEDPLPGAAELKAVALKLYEEVQLPAPDVETLDKIVDATLGLAIFPAEQSIALSLTPSGIDLDDLWSKKRQIVNATPGLSVWMGGEKFSDIGGCENIKAFLKDVANGRSAPRCICQIEEIEKAIGTGQDTSGVSQGLLQQLLTWLEDKKATGIILLGPPGCSKSLISKTFGNEMGIPTISVDLGGMKDSLVGSSEARLRNALQVIDAVSQQKTFWVGTCNSIAVLPPELRRRFSRGLFFSDLPDAAERGKIWELYRTKYELPGDDPIPDDEGWTGAEIRNCAQMAWDYRKPLCEVANYIVPVSKSAAAQIDNLRKQADSNYISTSYPGVYLYNRPKQAVAAGGRRIQFDEKVN